MYVHGETEEGWQLETDQYAQYNMGSIEAHIFPPYLSTQPYKVTCAAPQDRKGHSVDDHVLPPVESGGSPT